MGRTAMVRASLRAAAVALALVFAPQAGAQEQARGIEAVPETVAQIQLTFAPLVRSAAPAVVNIYARRIVAERPSPFANDPFFQQFFGPGFPGPVARRPENSLGSGVVMRADGLVMTNAHVIEGSEEITVVLSDRTEYAADVIVTDVRADLALLRLRNPNGRSFPTIPLGDSDSLEVGDLVLAIGNPFGVGQTVTSGIVSATARAAASVSEHALFIQTDAAINPGNSGGALIDMGGRLVGINTAIFTRSGGSMGIGFAVPVSMARLLLANAESGGPVVRPWMGASGERVTAEIANALGLEGPRGILVSQVYAGGPAARAGLRPGDVVLSVDGFGIYDPEALTFRIAVLVPGQSVELEVLRTGSIERLTMQVELPAADPAPDAFVVEGRAPFAGARIANLSPLLATELDLRDAAWTGVVVLEVLPRSPAQRYGFRRGDILAAVNGTAIDSIATMRGLLEQNPIGRWFVSVRRGGQRLELNVHG